jgi:3-hydroxybutyryl-CoA dehydrogenase
MIILLILLFLKRLQIYLLSTTYFCKNNYMTIAVWADKNQWEELTSGSTGVSWIKLESVNEIVMAADAYFILQDKINFIPVDIEKPVVINAVAETLQSLQLPVNVVRINAWPGFLARSSWEIAGHISSGVQTIMAAINKQIIPVKDEPGLVAARTIAMLINEAYFALGEGVSTKAAIDIAMQLGTNYPLGLFEWADKIGVQNIYSLLLVLQQQDNCYKPAPLLQQEATL